MRSSTLAPLDNVLVGVRDDEIVALEARLRAAQLSSDLDELRSLISEDLLFAGPDGALATKAQDLQAYELGIVRFLGHEPQELRIRRVGSSVAVTSLLTELTVSVHGLTTSGRFRYTRIWEQQSNGQWQVVGGHVSLVTGQPPNGTE